MNALAARRRHPAALFVLLLLALVATGSLYFFAAPKQATAVADTSAQVTKGQELFRANCATCHGQNAQGRDHAPSLAGVGAAAVDFQMGTGRMPAQMPGPQVRRNHGLYTQEDIDAIGAYVASLAPGPAVPAASDYATKGVDDARLSGALAGVAGVLIVLVLAGGLGYAVRRRDADEPAAPQTTTR